jgi:hypothetical protein
MTSRPYSKVIEILRSTLDHLEKSSSGKSDDRALQNLKCSLQQTIDALQAKAQFRCEIAEKSEEGRHADED